MWIMTGYTIFVRVVIRVNYLLDDILRTSRVHFMAAETKPPALRDRKLIGLVLDVLVAWAMAQFALQPGMFTLVFKFRDAVMAHGTIIHLHELDLLVGDLIQSSTPVMAVLAPRIGGHEVLENKHGPDNNGKSQQ